MGNGHYPLILNISRSRPGSNPIHKHEHKCLWVHQNQSFLPDNESMTLRLLQVLLHQRESWHHDKHH